MRTASVGAQFKVTTPYSLLKRITHFAFSLLLCKGLTSRARVKFERNVPQVRALREAESRQARELL